MTKATVYREKDSATLKEELVKLQKEKFNVRFQLAMANTENVSKHKLARRDIARIKTILNERKRNGELG